MDPWSRTSGDDGASPGAVCVASPRYSAVSERLKELRTYAVQIPLCLAGSVITCAGVSCSRRTTNSACTLPRDSIAAGFAWNV